MSTRGRGEGCRPDLRVPEMSPGQTDGLREQKKTSLNKRSRVGRSERGGEAEWRVKVPWSPCVFDHFGAAWAPRPSLRSSHAKQMWWAMSPSMCVWGVSICPQRQHVLHAERILPSGLAPTEGAAAAASGTQFILAEPRTLPQLEGRSEELGWSVLTCGGGALSPGREPQLTGRDPCRNAHLCFNSHVEKYL